jgi:hypothetical protein
LWGHKDTIKLTPETSTEVTAMRNYLLVALTGAGLFASTFAFADGTPPAAPAQPAIQPQAQAQPAAIDAQDRVVCRPMFHEGTVVHKGACLTQREWDRIRFEDQQALRDFQQRSLTGMGH